MSFPPQTSVPAGKRGKLVTLGSRKELDCLLQFINDQFDEPAFEVTIISQGKGSKIYGKKLRHFPLGVGPFPSKRLFKHLFFAKKALWQANNSANHEN